MIRYKYDFIATTKCSQKHDLNGKCFNFTTENFTLTRHDAKIVPNLDLS